MRSRAARAVLGLAVVGAAACALAQEGGVGAPPAPEERPPASEPAVPPASGPVPSPGPEKKKEKVLRHRIAVVPRFVGGGVTYGRVKSAAPGVGTQEGRGWNVYVAWDTAEWFALGFRAGAVRTRVTWTPDPSDTDTGAESGFFGVGALARFRAGHTLDPWIGLDLAYHAVTWNDYLHSVGGWGVMPSAGLDLRVASWGVVRFGASYSSFTATTSSFYGQTGPAPGPEDDGATAGMSTLWLTAGWIFDFGPAHF